MCLKSYVLRIQFQTVSAFEMDVNRKGESKPHDHQYVWTVLTISYKQYMSGSHRRHGSIAYVSWQITHITIINNICHLCLHFQTTSPGHLTPRKYNPRYRFYLKIAALFADRKRTLQWGKLPRHTWAETPCKALSKLDLRIMTQGRACKMQCNCSLVCYTVTPQPVGHQGT